MSPHCQNCGSHVSAEYARVLGDNEDRVEFCRHCPPEDLVGKRLIDTKMVGPGLGLRDIEP